MRSSVILTGRHTPTSYQGLPTQSGQGSPAQSGSSSRSSINFLATSHFANSQQQTTANGSLQHRITQRNLAGSSTQNNKNESQLPSDYLSKACQTQNEKVVTKAISDGAKPDEQTLTWACLTKNPAIVKSVIHTGARPDEPTLTCACMSGDLNIVKLVIDHGAQPDEGTLTAACASGNYSIVELVLAKGAKKNEKTLDSAAEATDSRILRAILNCAPEKPKASVVSTSLNRASTSPVLQPTSDRKSSAQLHSATSTARPAPVSQPRSDGRLTAACKQKNVDLVREAFMAGAVPDQETLYYACVSGDLKILQTVITAGAKPNPAFDTIEVGNSTLCWAIHWNNLEFVEAAVNAGVKASKDAMTKALSTGNMRIVNAIVPAGAKFDDKSLNTMLEFIGKNVYFFEQLMWAINSGAKPNKESINIGLKSKVNLEVISALINAGAIPDDKSIDLALSHDMIYHIPPLLKAGAKPSKDSFRDALVSSVNSSSNTTVHIEALIEAEAPPSEGCLTLACYLKHLPAIRWCLNKGFKPTGANLLETLGKHHSRSGLDFSGYGGTVDANIMNCVVELLNKGAQPSEACIQLVKRGFIGTAHATYKAKYVSPQQDAFRERLKKLFNMK